MQVNEFTIKVDGIDIAGQVYLPKGKGPAPVVCVCHGIPARAPVPGEKGYAVLAEQLCARGFGTVIFNFRGCGLSGGNLDLPGWEHDLEAVINYILSLPDLDATRMSLLGFSAGAAVSVCVAARYKRITAVAACACPAEFTRLSLASEMESLIAHYRDIGTIRDPDYPGSAKEWLAGFVSLRAIDCVAQLAPRPLLLVHGSDDTVVPVGDAHRLYARAGEPKKIVIVDRASHRLRHDAGAMNGVMDWLRQVNKLTRS